jgi:hypothetical protein
VAEHVKVAPAVSTLTVVAPQPVVEEIADWASVTDQVKPALPVYHPAKP